MRPLSLLRLTALLGLSILSRLSTVSADNPDTNAPSNPVPSITPVATNATTVTNSLVIPPEADWKSLPPHPRLFANAARWEELRHQITNDPVSMQLFEIQKKSADFLLTQPPVAFVKIGIRMLESMRQSLYRIETLASVARLTGDRRYVDGALVEMRGLASLPNWNPSHFLDVAEASMALAIGYDWLYQDLSPEDRALCELSLIHI